MRRNQLSLRPLAMLPKWGNAIVLCLACGCNEPSPTVSNNPAVDAGQVIVASNSGSQVEAIVGSEELILSLTPRLARLGSSFTNLCLPDHGSRDLFADKVRLRDIRSIKSSEQASNSQKLARHHWPVDPRFVDQPIDTAVIWNEFLGAVAYVEEAKFYFIDAQYVGASTDQFDSRIGFRARCFMRSGVWAAAQAVIRVGWKRIPGSADREAERWRIADWDSNELTTTESDSLFFDEVLDEAVPDASLRRRFRESRHWQYATRHYYPQRRAALPGGLADDRFFPISTAHHPGVSIVDIDDDGFDDIYVTVRWGPNMLLRNQGDGTFDETAADLGLDIDGRSNAAVFADFDNDGDKDVMIARSLERSMYLVNEDGQFFDRSEQISTPMPFEATSVSAADFNNDGLIDVYFSTYHQDDVSRRIDADLSHPEHRIHRYLSLEQSAEMKRRFREQHRSFINQIGPPNLLLVNRGDGRFEQAAESEQVAVWRNSFQSSWSDFDNDGDADLYVANDFAPDHLFRNDREHGFVDVSARQGIDKIGFAMGVSWGDYDNDGKRDLYVSNMYSKAGRRITQQIHGMDPRISLLATGNYLFRQHGQGFHLVSGLEAPKLTVARAGWAWGGQLADLDNDGFQDIYVASGYYTVPEEFETSVDL